MKSNLDIEYRSFIKKKILLTKLLNMEVTDTLREILSEFVLRINMTRSQIKNEDYQIKTQLAF